MFSSKVFSLPRSVYDLENLGVGLDDFFGYSRGKPEDYGFISLYSSLSEEALLIFVMFLPF